MLNSRLINFYQPKIKPEHFLTLFMLFLCTEQHRSHKFYTLACYLCFTLHVNLHMVQVSYITSVRLLHDLHEPRYGHVNHRNNLHLGM